jgi:hypothetical protein
MAISFIAGIIWVLEVEQLDEERWNINDYWSYTCICDAKKDEWKKPFRIVFDKQKSFIKCLTILYFINNNKG